MPTSKSVQPDAVAVYIRWSSDEQGEGTTLEVQQERCSLFVRSQGWEVNPELVFVEDGYSGGNLERPALTRLRQAVSAGRVDCVVTYRLDRLSRNLVDTVNLVRKEWLGRCIYRSASEGFDTADDSPTGALIFNILASFAEFERALIRERTYGGLLRRMKEGMYISGVVPFGYRRGAEKGTLAVKTLAADGSLCEEAAVVAYIFALATGPAPLVPTAIALQLNQQGIPSPAGGPWWATSVERILRNPVYAGHVVYGRRCKPVPGRQLTAAIAVADKVPAIVARAQFQAAQRNLDTRPGAKPRGKNHAREDYLLTTVATCRCGGPIGVVTDRHGRRYYRCARKSKGLGCAAGCKAFRAGPVDARVGQLIRERQLSMGVKDGALQRLSERLAGRPQRQEIEQALLALARRQEQVREDVARLLRQARRGELSPRTYEEFRTDSEAELRQLAERAARLRAEQEAAGRAHADLDRYRGALQAADEWDALPPASRKRLLRLVVKRLTLLGKGRGTVEAELEWSI